MSLHAPMTPEAQAQLSAQRRNSSITAVLMAILGCILVGMILLWIVLSPLFKETPRLVSYSAPLLDDEVIETPQVQNQVERKPSAPSSSMAKVIAANTASPFAVPVPDMDVPEVSMDFGNGTDFGTGWGSGSGAGAGGGGGTNSLFGRTGGQGMVGHFYDLKQDKRRKKTKLGNFYMSSSGGSRIGVYKKEFDLITRSRFSQSRLAKYFKAEQKLLFTHLVMEQTGANAAPKAFQVEKDVQPSGWMIVYEGTALKDSKEFRFVGRYDDVLVIYINNRVVFEGSWEPYTNAYQKSQDIPGPSLINRSMRASQYLRIRRGDKIRIVVGETPGGLVGGGILVQEKGKQYPNGYPPFATEPLLEDDKKRLRAMRCPIEVDNVPIFPIR